MKGNIKRWLAGAMTIIMLLSSFSVALAVETRAGGTAISEDRETGITQIQELIPDKNFAAAVYDALAADDMLGSEGQSIAEVLGNYEGDIIAAGDMGKVYTVSAIKVTYVPSLSTETI